MAGRKVTVDGALIMVAGGPPEIRCDVYSDAFEQILEQVKKAKKG
jgi:hypothetical protein